MSPVAVPAFRLVKRGQRCCGLRHSRHMLEKAEGLADERSTVDHSSGAVAEMARPETRHEHAGREWCNSLAGSLAVLLELQAGPPVG